MLQNDILILDPFQHFPSLKLMLDEKGFKTVYSTAITAKDIDNFQFYGNEKAFKKKYGFKPHDFTVDNSESYNIMILVFPINLTEMRPYYVSLIQKCKFIFESKSHQNTIKILIDNSDYPSDPMCDINIKSFGFHKVFKREMHRDREYHKLIMPFPFVIFGEIDPIYEYFFIKKKSMPFEKRIRKIFWSGSVFNHSNPDIKHSVDRRESLNLIYDCRNVAKFQLEQSFVRKKRYDELLSQHLFFLNLNGVGNVCKRFFEGLKYQGIPILESFKVQYPPSYHDLEEMLSANSFHSLDSLDALIDRLFSKSASELLKLSRTFQNEISKSKIINLLELS